MVSMVASTSAVANSASVCRSHISSMAVVSMPQGTASVAAGAVGGGHRLGTNGLARGSKRRRPASQKLGRLD